MADREEENEEENDEPEETSSGLNTMNRTRKRFLDSLRQITAVLEDEDEGSLDAFAIEIGNRFKKQSRTTPQPKKASKKAKQKKGSKPPVYKCRLTCLADHGTASIRNLHKILPLLNSSGLGVAPHERSSHESPNRQSSSLPLVWNAERLKSFIEDTFPALENLREGYDLMYADSNKSLHLIPADIDTPEKLKSYATGRSALYIRPRCSISLAGSSSSVTNQHTSLSGGANLMVDAISYKDPVSPPDDILALLPQPDVVVMTEESYSVPTSTDVDIGDDGAATEAPISPTLPSFTEAMGAERSSSLTTFSPMIIDCDIFVPQCLLQLRNTLKEKRILSVQRQTLVDDLFKAYEDPMLAESEIEVHIRNEDAVDFGGVTRDIFCSFWDKVINDNELFSGAECKIPVFNASNAMSVMTKLPILGRIMSHSYLVTGYFPTAISLASVVSLFLGITAVIDDETLLSCLYDFLPRPDSDFIRQALSLSCFDESTLDRLLEIYAVNGVTRIPKPTTLRQDMLFLATFLFRLQPVLCYNNILSGMPESHKLAWCSLQINDFIKIYKDQSLSAEKVIQALSPDHTILSPDEERVFYFLKTYIRETSPNCLKRLVRFITGSSNLLVSSLPITFHSAKQYPKAMTCSQTIILSSRYQSYSSFRDDFNSILQNEDSFLMLCV